MRVAVRRKNVMDNRGDPKWRPLRVVARMAEPVVYYGDGLHLDGILSWGAYRAMEDKARLPPVSAVEFPIDFLLPVAKWVWPGEVSGVDNERVLTKGGKAWGWCCSAVQDTWLRHSMTQIRKKPALEEMARLTTSPSANLGAGSMKAYDLPMPTSFALELVWYALGDADEVKRLLDLVPAVGKKINLGNGRVLEWAVEAVDEDKSIWDGDKLMRRMPAGTYGGHATRRAIRPPYYHRSRLMDCVEASNA